MIILLEYKSFDTSHLFTGGAGMFCQYHDIIKPIYFYAVISMIITKQTYGLPVNIISSMSLQSLFEWYKQRRYINPLCSLDYNHISDFNVLNDILEKILMDESIYKLSPLLNISRILQVYHQQHMSFPIYIYSEKYNKYIENDIHRVLNGYTHYYVYGNLDEATKKCRENFTYIFSDIELLKSAADVLMGTYSHVVLARDYRYNCNGYELRYDLHQIMSSHPFLRVGTTTAMDYNVIGHNFSNIIR